MTIHKIEDDTDLDEFETGKMFLFWIEAFPDDETFTFSSTLENIPNRKLHDRSLKNKTKVLVLSEPMEAWHPAQGKFLVSKIMAHEIMWVSTNALHLLNE